MRQITRIKRYTALFVTMPDSCTLHPQTSSTGERPTPCAVLPSPSCLFPFPPVRVLPPPSHVLSLLSQHDPLTSPFVPRPRPRMLCGRLALRLNLARQAEAMLSGARRLCEHLGESPSLQTDIDVRCMPSPLPTSLHVGMQWVDVGVGDLQIWSLQDDCISPIP